MADVIYPIKLTYRALNETGDAMDAIRGRLRARGFLWGGETVSREQIFNAMVLCLSHLPDEQREGLLRDGLALLDESARGGASRPASGLVDVEVKNLDPPSPAKGRKKGG